VRGIFYLLAENGPLGVGIHHFFWAGTFFWRVCVHNEGLPHILKEKSSFLLVVSWFVCNPALILSLERTPPGAQAPREVLKVLLSHILLFIFVFSVHFLSLYIFSSFSFHIFLSLRKHRGAS